MADAEPPQLSLRDRVINQRASFRDRAIKESEYAHIGEGKIGSWIEQRPLSEVDDALPTFHGRRLTEIANLLPANSRVWDLGSGDRAVALSQLVNQNLAQHLIGIGVTLPVERENLNHPDNVDVVRMDVDEYLKKFDRSQRPDLIYMSKLLRWVPNPLFTLKLAYNALQTDGTLLVDEINNWQSPLMDINQRPVAPGTLETYLKEHGYDIEIVAGEKPFPTLPDYSDLYSTYSVAIRKTDNHPHLNLPIRVVTPQQLAIDLPRVGGFSIFAAVPKDIQYMYLFDPKPHSSTTSDKI